MNDLNEDSADELDPAQEAERERQSVASFTDLAQSLARYADVKIDAPKRR